MATPSLRLSYKITLIKYNWLQEIEFYVFEQNLESAETGPYGNSSFIILFKFLVIFRYTF